MKARRATPALPSDMGERTARAPNQVAGASTHDHPVVPTLGQGGAALNGMGACLPAGHRAGRQSPGAGDYREQAAGGDDGLSTNARRSLDVLLARLRAPRFVVPISCAWKEGAGASPVRSSGTLALASTLAQSVCLSLLVYVIG